MCVAYPYKIKSSNSKKAWAEAKGDSKEIKLDLVSDIKKGDWVLVSNNYAVSKISEDEAKRMINLIDETIEEGKANAC